MQVEKGRGWALLAVRDSTFLQGAMLMEGQDDGDRTRIW